MEKQQFYPECAQLNIINGGSLEPTSSELVTFPGGYSDSDPGLSVVLYSSAAQTQTTYKVPGPPLYAGVNGGGSSPQPSTVGTTAKPSSSSSTKPVTTIAPSSTTKVVTTSPTSSAAGPLASAYAQCGGKGWTGATSCSSGYTCKASGDYYSQCLP
jgi:cellulase